VCCVTVAEPAALKSFILQKGVRGELDAVSALAQQQHSSSTLKQQQQRFHMHGAVHMGNHLTL
jgi:hypothetical protein